MYALIRGKQLHYDITGINRKGEDPILLVHGWGGSAESLSPLAKILSATNKVILVDLPGFGKSDLPDIDWGVEEYSDVVADLLKVLKFNKVVYFGHSFGGSIGIYLSAKKPNLISFLILCNSAYKRSGRRSILAKIFHHVFPKNNPPFRLFLYRLLFRSSDLAKFPILEQNFRKILKHDLADLPNKITCKTLILWGDRDTITPIIWAHELKEKIPNSTLKIIPNTGHALPLKSPEVVADEVYKFINS